MILMYIQDFLKKILNLDYEKKSKIFSHNIPISIKVDTGSKHDSTIFNEQMVDIYKKIPQIFNKTNILIADGAYDSVPLQNLIKKLNFKKLVTNKNIRNLKDKIKINLYDKMLLRKRICVEHSINKFKKFKRIHLRYDRYSEHFKSYIFMASILIIIKNTGL